MTPLRESSNWTERHKDKKEEIEPLRRYYLIFEGDHTERKYFKGIDDYRKELGINSMIDIVVLSKEGEIRGFSDPHKILELVNEKKVQLKDEGVYDEDRDQFVLIIDRDSFDNKDDFMAYVEQVTTNNILTITNPCFELWLILHYEDAVEKYITNNVDNIIANEKVSKTHTYISKLFSDISGTNSKSRLIFHKLKEGVERAIMQERILAQTYEELATSIGSNVGVLIEEMKEDPREEILKK